MEKPSVSKQKLLRCVDWLEKQNNQKPVKPSVQKKNYNVERRRFQWSSEVDTATVPPGVDDNNIEPKVVPIKKLRKEHLRMECEWQSCRWVFYDYELFQKHVKEHIADLHIIGDKDNAQYVCLWDVCGHKTSDHREMIRHVNYHAYHSHLLAIGFNGRATLRLTQCKKDSRKRNRLPLLKGDHVCMWTGCEEKYHTSIQAFFDHVRLHTNYSEGNLCSWGGCGQKFSRRVLLTMHMRSHTCEKLIACYHCGRHFSCNGKLSNHLRRQNVDTTEYRCTLCGSFYATKYLLTDHMRRHVSGFACSLCDMSAVSRAALARHVRYKHLTYEEARTHPCPHCDYAAVTKSDLGRHIARHKRNRKKLKRENRTGINNEHSDDPDLSDEESSEEEVKKNIPRRKYACHICPENEMKIFSQGARLTRHLFKVHEAQSGNSRFRYHLCEDGMYRLILTRYEFLDVCKEVVAGEGWPTQKLTGSVEFNLELKAEPTHSTPIKFEITLKSDQVSKMKEECNEINNDKENYVMNENAVEITMMDVDEKGNVINSNVINSEIVVGMQ